MFETLPLLALDPILEVMRSFEDDPRPNKLDLGIGVYRNQFGLTPVMNCVKVAEQYLIDHQSTKSYLGSDGNRTFSSLLCDLVVGEANVLDVAGTRLCGFHTIGGTGALRLTAEMVARSSGNPRIWIGTPTWPNHLRLFGSAGLQIQTYPYYDVKGGAIDIARTMDASVGVAPGDAFLLHGPCHNPTGSDLDSDSLRLIGRHVGERGAILVIDVAYAGLHESFDKDLSITRNFIKNLEEVIVCFSCSKTFGLYRERVGLMVAKLKRPGLAERLRGALSQFALANYAMPPDHGAAVVSEIIGNTELKASWLSELEGMRSSILKKRKCLTLYPALTALSNHRGMFSILDLPSKALETLKRRFGVYIPDGGRINVLGIVDGAEDYFAYSVTQALSDA